MDGLEVKLEENKNEILNYFESEKGRFNDVLAA